MPNSSKHPKFVVRMPDDLRDRVDSAATESDCSMNTIFVRAVRQYLDGQDRQRVLLDLLEKAAGQSEGATHANA